MWFKGLNDPIPESEKAKYSVGTLSYTKAGLFMMFAWMLWGDFCFSMMEVVGGLGIISLYMMEKMSTSLTAIAIITSTIPNFLGVVVGPIVSFKSDRYRSKWGRRIPFVLLTAPFLCVFLIGLGFTDDINTSLTRSAWLASIGISPQTMVLIIVGVMVAGFCFFNEFVNSIWWYLFNDVVPSHFIGRFMAGVRITTAMCGFLFSAFLFQYQLMYMRWIFMGAALLYFIGFSVTCLKVKEGEYPPVTDVGKYTSKFEQIKLYFKECFFHPIYIAYYLGGFTVAVVAGTAGGLLYFQLHVSQHVAEMAHHDVRDYESDTSPAIAAAMLPGDQRFAVCHADGRLSVWNPRHGKRGECLLDIDTGKPAVGMALAPGGAEAVVASADGSLSRWSLTDGKCLKSVPGAAPAVAMALSPDGRTAYLAGDGGLVSAVSLDTGKTIWTSEAGAGQLKAVAVSSDGGRLLAASNLGGEAGGIEVAVFDPATGGRTALFKRPDITGINAIRVIPSFLNHDGTLSIAKKRDPRNIFGQGWDAVEEYFTVLTTLDTIYRYAPSPDECMITPDRWFACAGEDNNLHIMDIEEGEEIMRLKGHKKPVLSLAYLPEVNMLMSGGADRAIYVWRLTHYSPEASDNSLRNFVGYTHAVTALAPPSKGEYAVTADSRGTSHFWNLIAGITLKQRGIFGSVLGLLTVILAYPFGALVDRFNALRVTVYTVMIIIPVQFAGYFFIYGYWSYLSIEIVKSLLFSVIGAAGYPMMMMIFPRDKFGQFCSANGLVNQFTRTFFIVGGAYLMDLLTHEKLWLDNLRYAYIFVGFAFAAQFCCLWFVYKKWHQLGGGGGKYIAPGSAEDVHAGGLEPEPALD